MKNYAVALLIFAGFFIGCSSTKSIAEKNATEQKNEIEEDVVGGEVSIKLYSKDKADTVESFLKYMFFEKALLPYQDSVNRIVKEYVAGTVSNGGGRVQQDSDLSIAYMEDAMDKFKEAYDTEMSMYDDDGYFGGVWSTETSVEIHFDKTDYVEVSFYNWNYAGGAHGNSASEQRLIEISTGRELMLADFFTDVNKLNAIAEEIFRADQEVPEGMGLEEAGFWFEDGQFQLNENFVFNEETLDFLYNPYEIAPYAAGMIIISIPMDRIKDLLKREVR